MKKVIWRHPSAHKTDVWVEDFEFKDDNGIYLAKDKDSSVKVYLKDNKGIIIQ